MQFKISRASDPYGHNQPCKDAKFVRRQLWSRIGTRELLERLGEYNDFYEIEINSLEDLVKLIEENGEIVMGSDWIMIYDEDIE